MSDSWLKYLVLIPGLFVLPSCSSDNAKLLECPRAGALSDAAHVTKFLAASGQDMTDVEYEATIKSVALSCDVDDDEVDVELEMVVDVYLGPAATSRTANLQYFIAIMSGETIRKKQIMPLNVSFPEPLRSSTVSQSAELTIPVPENFSARNYEILVGFQLTPEQLMYNRALR